MYCTCKLLVSEDKDNSYIHDSGSWDLNCHSNRTLAYNHRKPSLRDKQRVHWSFKSARTCTVMYLHLP